ncbi:hypothetical protein JHD45_20595 [Marinomonas spartinae]|nr:hypothetical protein [Marinomonas spartinae]
MALYSPQALAIADGSVGLIELESHVRVGRYQDLIKRSPILLSRVGFFRSGASPLPMVVWCSL